MLNRYVSRAEWLGIIDLQEWWWEEARRGANGHRWPMQWEHLLEAYLRLGMDSKANEFVSDMGQSSNWEENKQAVIDLAKKCGKETLAERWGKM
jgi:hypothetical protein